MNNNDINKIDNLDLSDLEMKKIEQLEITNNLKKLNLENVRMNLKIQRLSKIAESFVSKPDIESIIKSLEEGNVQYKIEYLKQIKLNIENVTMNSKIQKLSKIAESFVLKPEIESIIKSLENESGQEQVEIFDSNREKLERLLSTFESQPEL